MAQPLASRQRDIIIRRDLEGFDLGCGGVRVIAPAFWVRFSLRTKPALRSEHLSLTKGCGWYMGLTLPSRTDEGHSEDTQMHALTHAHTCAHRGTCTHVHSCTHSQTFAHMYTCTHMCMHSHTFRCSRTITLKLSAVYIKMSLHAQIMIFL